MKVTAIAQRCDKWWSIRVPEVEGVFTQARRLDQVARMAADAVALMTDTPPESIQVDIQVELPPATQQAIDAAKSATEAAKRSQLHAAQAMYQAIDHMRSEEGLPMRDVAIMLGITHQRVSQIANAPSRPRLSAATHAASPSSR